MCVLLIILVICLGKLLEIWFSILLILVFFVIIVCVNVLWFVLNIFLKLWEKGLWFKLCNNVVYNVSGWLVLFYVFCFINVLLIIWCIIL